MECARLSKSGKAEILDLLCNDILDRKHAMAALRGLPPVRPHQRQSGASTGRMNRLPAKGLAAFGPSCVQAPGGAAEAMLQPLPTTKLTNRRRLSILDCSTKGTCQPCPVIGVKDVMSPHKGRKVLS